MHLRAAQALILVLVVAAVEEATTEDVGKI